MTDPKRPWLEHYDPEVPHALNYESVPLFAHLDRAARDYPARTAIIFKNARVSYKELKRLTEVFAASLRRRGLRPGERVAIMLPNLPQSIIAYWGVLKAGGVVVMVNPLYMEKELIHQITDSGARFMVVLDLLWEKVAPLKERLPVEAYFVTRIPDALKFPINMVAAYKLKRAGKAPVVPYDGKQVAPYKELLRGKERYSCEQIAPETDTALLQYTGGTTGVAKGCMLTHSNLSANVMQCRSMLHGIGSVPETFLGVLPYFHVYGLTVCLNLATSIAATLAPFPRFEPKELLAAVDKIKPTIFPGAPSLYIALMQQKTFAETDFAALRYCVSGSAAMPVEVIERFRAITGAQIIEGYGLTEASPVTHLNPLDGLKKDGSIGLPFPDTEARIVDMEVGGPPLPPGKMGEMVIKGPQVMKGYWNRPDDTASTLRNGWLYTGDVATMDEEGYFFIVDRKKDMIISAGYNIYPREIDEVLYEHPKIKEAVAVGIPHKARGEIVKAYVVPVEGEELSKTEILSFCREKLASYKVPRKIEFRNELPKTLVGKVLRRALRAEEAEKKKQKSA